MWIPNLVSRPKKRAYIEDSLRENLDLREEKTAQLLALEFVLCWGKCLVDNMYYSDIKYVIF
jgi:hypothetical protein